MTVSSTAGSSDPSTFAASNSNVVIGVASSGSSVRACFSPITLYAATDLGVYRSLDGAQHWERFGAGLPLANVMDLYVSPDGSLIRAATFGRGFWELTQ